MSSKKERSKRPLQFLIFLGILVTIFGIYFYLSDNDSKKVLPIVTEPTKPTPLHLRENPTQLIIPSLKLDLSISEGKIIDGIWQLNRYDVSHLDISANPGENGNIVIYGHNLKVLFGSLPYINIGATIKVITEDGKEHTYKVYSKKTVKADDISIVWGTPSEVLTLYTCDGLLDSTRFVLLAKPISI